MQFDPNEKLVDRISQISIDSAERLNGWGVRLATWLVLGNAASLVLISTNPQLAEASIATATIKQAAVFFAAGLILAFLGAAAGYLFSIVTLFHINAMMGAIDTFVLNRFHITELEKNGIEVPIDAPLREGIDDAGKRIEALQGFKAWAIWGTIGTLIIFAMSAIAFCIALLQLIFTR